METYNEFIKAIENLEIGYAIFQDFAGKRGVFRVITTALAKKLGFLPEEIIDKKSFTEFLPPDVVKLVEKRYEDRLKGENPPSHYEIPVISKDGARMFFDAYIQPISYEGKPATLGFYLDITPRKLMEEEIKANLRTQRELITAINHAPEVIFITDIEGTIKYVNPVFTEVTGYTQEEVIGKKASILKSGKHSKEFYKELWETLLSGKIWQGEFINKRKDGSTYIDESIIAPVFDETGKIISFIAIKRDVTQEKKFQEQIIQSQKMEALGLLASGVAHDFNNILGGILGYTDILKLRYKDDKYLNNILDKMEQAGKKAADLIDKLLTISRTKEEKGDSIEIIDVNKHIKDVIELLSRTMPKNVETRLYLDESKPITIEANPVQIEQVIMNICINGYQAMKEKGGELTIETKRFFPDEEFLFSHYGLLEREYIQISISDTGHGIDKKDIDKIFDPFFTTKKKGGGTGLGLSTAYNIITSYNGIITVYSEKGKGTTFNIYLPFKEGVEIQDAEKGKLLRGKGKILIIDDEDIVRDMLMDVLEELGYNYIIGKDGKDGVEVFKKHYEEIDLVMIDMNMPGYTGEEVLKIIREIKPSVKVILTSGFGLNGMLKGLLEDGNSAFLHKPFSLGELSETLSRLLAT